MSFCSVPEHALADAARNICQWPKGVVPTYSIAEKLDAFTDAEYLELCDEAWAPWEARSGFRVEYLDQPNANIILTTARIDGPFGILADMMLPCGNVTSRTQLVGRFDVGETWVNADNPAGRMIDGIEVFRHEFGHAIGIGHWEQDDALMNPTISGNRRLRPWDIEQVVLRHGDPSETPGPGGESACETMLRGMPCFATEESRKTALKAWALAKKSMGISQ